MTCEVTCGRCKGTGRRPLSAPLAAALRAVSREWQETGYVEAIYAAANEALHPTTMLARLSALHRLGLVERRKADLRTYEWRVP